jgi:hypothetical protein
MAGRTGDDLARELGREPASEELRRDWAKTLMRLGRALEEAGLAYRLDEIASDSPVKQVALKALRLGTEG